MATFNFDVDLSNTIALPSFDDLDDDFSFADASSTEEEAEMMKVLSLFIHSAYCQQGFATFSQLDFAINMDFINF